MKRFISSLLLVTFCSSCDKGPQNIYEQYFLKNETQKQDLTKTSSENSYQAWLQLTKNKAPNLALAELMASSVAKENAGEVKKIVQELSEKEIKDILNEVSFNELELENQFIFHRSNSLEDKILPNASIFRSDLYKKSQSDSYMTQIQLKTYGYIRSKALNEILTAYNNQLAEYSRPIAVAAMRDYLSKNPNEALKLENTINSSSKVDEAVTDILKAIPLAEKVGSVFTGMSRSEQAFAVTNMAVAGIIYYEIKDKKSFKKVIEFYKELKTELEDLKLKVKQLNVIASAIGQFHQEMDDSINQFGKGVQGITNDAKKITSASSNSSLDTKKVYNNIYNQLIKGGDATNSNIAHFDLKNIQTCANASLKMANSLNTIIDTTKKVAGILGVKIPEDIEKVFKKTQEIATIVNGASKIINGFANGGVLGAASALTTSLGLSPDPLQSKLAMLDAKMDQLIASQKRMLELQIETMKMIKNLSVMVDEYHQQEMEAISEVRDLILVNLEIEKTRLNDNIRSCERMVRNQLSSVWQSQQQPSYYNGAPFISQNASLFNASFKSFSDIKNFVRSLGENDFVDCQKAMGEAFGGTLETENPLRLIYTTDKNNKLTEFNETVYTPLVIELQSGLGEISLQDALLNIPMQNFSGLKLSKLYYGNAKNTDSAYDIENLYSEHLLERYASQLLILYPFLELDKSDWTKNDISGAINTYYENLNYSGEDNQNLKYRSYVFLSNALKITQSIIAQESLLSGGPLLESLYQNKSLFLGKTPCPKSSGEELTPEKKLFHSVRLNRLLMRNLLNYSLWKEAQTVSGALTFDSYEAAFESKQLSTLASFVGAELSRVIVKGEDIFLQVEDPNGKIVEVKFPTSDDLKNGTIIYSENMQRVVKIQDRLVEALGKVSPLQGSPEKMAKILIFQTTK